MVVAVAVVEEVIRRQLPVIGDMLDHMATDDERRALGDQPGPEDVVDQAHPAVVRNAGAAARIDAQSAHVRKRGAQTGQKLALAAADIEDF